MRQVQAHGRAHAPCRGDDGGKIQRLSGEILNTGQQHQRQSRSLAFDPLDHIFGSQSPLALPRFDLDEMLRRIQSMEGELRDDGMAIGWKGGFLDQYPAAPGVGAKETHHHQVQIHRQRIHGDDLGLLGPDESGERCGGVFVIADPGPRGLGVPENGQAAPVFELLFNVVRGGFGLQSERVAA